MQLHAMESNGGLLSFGANPNQTDTVGRHAMHYAAEHGNVKLVSLILNEQNKVVFDWNGNINKEDDYFGRHRRVFDLCLENEKEDGLEILQYLFEIQETRNDAVPITFEIEKVIRSVERRRWSNEKKVKLVCNFVCG